MQNTGFPGGSVGKESTWNPRDKEDVGLIPGLGRSPGGGMAAHSSILSWRILRTEEPGGLKSRTWLKRLSTNAEYINLVTVSLLFLFLVTLWVLVYCSNNLNLLFCISSFPGCTERECLQDTEKGCQICPFLCVFVHVHMFGCWMGMVGRDIDGWWGD